MAKRLTRQEVNRRLRAQLAKKKALLMFGAGIGLTAKCAEKGGADLIGVYSTAIFRMRGLPSLLAWLPYGNVTEDLLKMAGEIVPVVKDAPLIAGVGAHDPSLDLDSFLDKLADMGFSGVTNEPFAAMYGEYFLNEMEKSGIGFSREVELIRIADKKDMFSVAWAMSPDQARQMAEAGADVIGGMIGVTTGGMSGTAETASLDDAVAQINAIMEAARKVNPDILVLTHGGPLNDVETARASIQRTGAHGYAAGSSGERIPTERAIVAITEAYRDIDL
ncbi:phosphoenolpyruvate hydrolase family protein [Desulfovibrio sp. OttesenSCG-928-O18]|nr:phosphoenolpyruvate hydrolase family protein [Desulfovibrio sp. OttesenSCG-928-O18]